MNGRWWLAGWLLGCGTLVLAQPAAPPPNETAGLEAPADTDEGITLALENADIKELIRWAADHISRNIIMHPDVKGQVTVLSGAPLSRDEAYQVFLSTLQVYGYAVIATDQALQVVPAEVANQGNAPLTSGRSAADRATPAPFDEEVVVQVVKVNRIAASQLVTLLRPLLPSSALLTAYPDSNLLLVSARAKQIERLRAVISHLDQGGAVDIEVLSLEYASAKDISQMLTNLLTRGGSQPDGKSFTLAVDDRTNSLLMTGDPILRQQVRGLVSKLDRPRRGTGNTQVIRVRFADAEKLVPILQGVSTSLLRGDQNQANTQVETKIEFSAEQNALVITAPPALLDSMKEVISELDVRRPQVIVEAIIVEVSEDVVNTLGVQWSSSLPGDDGVFGGSNTFPPGLATPAAPGLGPGLTLGFYRSGDLRGLIRALKSNTAANLLSTPTIVALDNEEAQILVGSNVPFITGQSTGSSSSTDNPFQTIERKDIGVTLKVKPRINDDSSITMTIDQTVESIALSTANTADIVTNKRNVATRVVIENDAVLVLGGLIQNDINDQQARIPVLGDLPVVGRLFRSTNTQVTKKNLMVFIHPRILANNQDNEVISVRRYDELRERQQIINERSDRIFIPSPPPLLPGLGEAEDAHPDDPALAPIAAPAPAATPVQ